MAVFTGDLDVTADAVIVELDRRGVPVFRCDPAAFPASATLAARFGGSWTGHLRTARGTLDLSDVACAWWLRPPPITVPADTPHADWVRVEDSAGLRGVLAALPWLNHPDDIRAVEHKPVQLATASAVGLTVPATLLTNDPAEARAFAEAHAPVIYKPITSGLLDDQKIIYTVGIALTAIDDSVAVTAHLFQQPHPRRAARTGAPTTRTCATPPIGYLRPSPARCATSCGHCASRVSPGSGSPQRAATIRPGCSDLTDRGRWSTTSTPKSSNRVHATSGTESRRCTEAGGAQGRRNATDSA